MSFSLCWLSPLFTPAWVGGARVAGSGRLGALVLAAWLSLQRRAMRGRGLPGMWAVPVGACLPPTVS